MVNRTDLPWIGRMFCRWLWHSWRGVLNEHGALEWLVCRRCGERRNLIWDKTET